jgi:alkaline phosphatase
VALYEPGEYEATLKYYGNQTTVANWVVRDLAEVRKTKNVVLFIGDGMTTNMITAARLIAHKSINGKYQTKMAMDKFPVLGHQMTHSMDSFITDSANSATALYSGHKTTVNALNVYVDSSPSPFDDPKFETIAEIFRRVYPGAGVGIVSTAFLGKIHIGQGRISQLTISQPMLHPPLWLPTPAIVASTDTLLTRTTTG